MPVDSRVKDFIRQQVSEGITSVAEIRRQSIMFVKNQLFHSESLPSRLNRRFFPNRRDIANFVYRTRVACMHSHVDQENLQTKIAEWKIASPNDSFHFRPYVDDVNSSSCVDTDDIIMYSSGSRCLLVIYQSEAQKRLLQKCGDLCLLDATYKTCRYAVPLFFLCVRTNVDYTVVATFVTQYEDSASIREALEVISSWNTTWSPKSCMVDFCEAEINALESVFPGMLL